MGLLREVGKDERKHFVMSYSELTFEVAQDDYLLDVILVYITPRPNVPTPCLFN